MSETADQERARLENALRQMSDIDRPGAITEAVLNDAGATTPEPAYDGGNDLITVALSRQQVGLIVYCLMEQSKQMPVTEQMDWARLALGLNDLLVAENEVHRGGAESD
jgi:hypothetical protein